jgi:hypothetical protein
VRLLVMGDEQAAMSPARLRPPLAVRNRRRDSELDMSQSLLVTSLTRDELYTFLASRQERAHKSAVRAFHLLHRCRRSSRLVELTASVH